MANPQIQLHVSAPDSIRVPWVERNPSDRQALLTRLLALVSNEALQGETLEAVLQRIVDCIVCNLPVTIASIILLDDQRTEFVQEVSAGRLDLEVPGGLLPWPVTVGAAGRCIRSGEAQLITDLRNDPDYVAGNLAVQSEYLVPIRHHDRLHGVLNLESMQADFFTREVRSVFDAVAVQIAGAVHLARVVRELELINARLQRLSMRDGLTGIANRRCFDEQFALHWQCHSASGRWLALVLVDVDFFKRLNDACGHVRGDMCLRQLAQTFDSLVDGTGGMVARYGGEEFVLLLPGQDLRQARRTASLMRARVRACALPHPASPLARYVTISAGVSATRPDAQSASDSLIACADRALYRAKMRGRDRVCAASYRAMP